MALKCLHKKILTLLSNCVVGNVSTHVMILRTLVKAGHSSVIKIVKLRFLISLYTFVRFNCVSPNQCESARPRSNRHNYVQ